jgi:predicted PurR-regulated permease PerM
MLTVGLMVFLLMWPFFGFLDAMVLGLIAAVFEAIPYLGPFLSAVPALLFALGEGGLTRMALRQGLKLSWTGVCADGYRAWMQR